ncbi:T9SS type A sorting domain-containing protein [Prevotella sp.]|uniref:T9SS type A sorting domain-containing protein n=1 Tax=Prevotella sp. TaxID=59823 RepID=UPI0025EAD3B8|nr:T9SS type A sorting domain-containing protein [Prevotella sp.]MCI6129220.1 T9SS type A sorting domain-containing protein [Prevotella sp.]
MKIRNNNINRHAKSKRLLLQLFAMIALAAAPNCVYAQSLGFHYKGHSGMPLDSRGMQQTAEWHYNYYLPTSKSTMALNLPFVGWTGECNDLEPYGWIRWYDYTTDKASDQLTPYDDSWYTKLLQGKDKNSGTDIGLCAYEIPTPPQNYSNYVGVYYKKPSGADAADWAGDTIACDVSRYIDGTISKSGRTYDVTKEPTLTIRYIFHIRSAAYLANKIKTALCEGSAKEYADLTLEDNKRIVFGAKNDAAKMTLRTNLKNSGGQTYWFYPLRTTKGKTVYPTTEAQKITAADFNTTMKQANKIVWTAYNEDKRKFCQLSSTTQFCDLTINALKNATWRNVSNGATTTKPTDIGFEQTVYVVAWAANGTNYMCPVANFEVLIHKGYPKTKEELTADGDVDRTISYFEDKYEQQMDISFDDDNPDLTLDAPTTPSNNMSLKPSDFKSRAYGFTYAELASQDYYNGSTRYGRSPIHGDYGLYKSGNLSGISANGKNGYLWWANGSPTIYDRTYEKTGGKQYGHFLYVDASDESRQIASADFQAYLCTGSQLVFSGAVAEYTAANAAAPQVMFRLYGINKDKNGNVIDQKLIQSFTSGDFATNTKDHKYGKWYQIFSKQVLQKSTGVSNFTDFRIVLDNMCKSTGGADYCIDDLCLYTQTSKLDVLQNRPLCPNETGYETAPEDITLKLRGIYETFQAMVNQKESKLFYRICDATGKPVDNIDYDGDGQPDAYGIASIPASYNAGSVLPPAAADGKNNVAMFENDNSGNRCLVIANRNFNIVPGKDYYFSIAYPSDDNPDVPGDWGKSTDVCSTYSDRFQVVEQNIKLTDKNSNVLTALRVDCNSNTPTVEVIAKIETADPVNGGKVTIDNVKFDWFLSKPNAENELYSTPGLLEAIHNYRAKYPSYNGLSTDFRSDNPTQYALLKKYVDSKQLILNASNSMGNRKFEANEMGLYKIAVIPVQAKATINGQVYEICADPMLVDLRVVTDGPNINFGFPGVIYPNDARTVRVGLPQIKAIAAKNGALNLPMTGIEGAKSVKMIDEAQVSISNTNDPDFNSTKQAIGVVTANTIYETDNTVGIRFNSNAVTTLKEGYWYEINFRYANASASTASCPGETFIKMCIVPEYATWNSSPRTASTNWNDDNNWLRSTKAEIFKDSYADYNTTTAFMPMKFTKVTVANQKDKGKVYPNLDEISYRSNGIASSKKMQSFAYDFVAKWSNTADGSDNGYGTFSCEKWAGNFCDQIYFKPEAELLYANYLTYNKAYVEKELTPNTWSIMSSPLQQTYAGDLYVPKNNGQEQSEAFQPMTYDENVNDRSAYPIYQRSWDGDVEEVSTTTTYKANHDGTIVESQENELTLKSAYWTHVYNKADEAYAKGKAFAVKAGDKYTAGAQNNAYALIRLPKADTQYNYYDSQSKTNVSATVQKTADNYRMQLGDNINDKTLTLTQPLNQNVHEGNSYHLVGNPYTSSLSMYHFLKTNTAFESSVWTFTDGKFTAHAIDTSLDYDKKKDVIIPPTQAFFVKVKNGEAPTDVTFNAAMIINRWVTPGEKIMLVRPTLTMTTSDGVRSSQSELIVNDEASRDYVEGEDVEMLGEGNIAEIAQVYSVAGTQAVALNASDDINWMPVGVVAPKSKDIDVNISLNSKMLRKMNDEGGKLFVYDATSKKFSEIADGMKVQMMANDHGRYYITTNNWVVPTGINAIRCFSPAQGTIIVAVLNGEVKQAKVYDTAGALVTSSRSTAGERCQLSVQQPGVYIVKATTMDDKTETFKIVVK